MFAVIVHERPPLKMDDLFGMNGLIASWVQDAGGYAALGLAIWLVAYALHRGGYLAEQRQPLEEEGWPRWCKWLFIFFVCTAFLAYLTYAFTWITTPTSAQADPLGIAAAGSNFLA